MIDIEEKRDIIVRINRGESVLKIARKKEISRNTIYKIIKNYKRDGEEGLNEKSPGRPKKRKIIYKKVKGRRLKENQRFKIIKDIEEQKRSITDIANENRVSRNTVYKWLKRYRQAKEEDKKEAIKNKKREYKRYPNQTPEKYEKEIIKIVKKNPEYGIRSILEKIKKINGKPIVNHHGIQNILKRNGLNTYELRVAYAKQRRLEILKPEYRYLFRRLKLVLEQFIPTLAPAPPPEGRLRRVGAPFQVVRRSLNLLKIFVTSTTISIVFTFGYLYLRRIGIIFEREQNIGVYFAAIALLMGSIFLLYSFKYYISLAIVLSFSQQGGTKYRDEGNKRKYNLLSNILRTERDEKETSVAGPVGLEPNLQRIRLKRYPYISIHVPFYNEKNVAKRLIAATTNFDYKGEYEVIIADDSTDKTYDIVREYQKQFLVKGEKLVETKGDGWTLTEVKVKPGVALKHLHRTTRSGFKGGALKEALKHTNPKTEFVSVFDADFVPYPDTLDFFIKYFKVQNNMDEDYTKSNLAVVQGYQWHVLNKSENWITRGIRCEYAGSYVIERPGREILGGLKQISGSVYMIRKDVLERLGWGTSITEDFQLTLRLYEKGYKVVFTPYIQAPAECVSTIKRLIRQRMRWAEGHSNNVKKMFFKLVFNKNLNFSEKVEFLYLVPYYLQALFFLIGTTAWILSETLFKGSVPFWTSLWGWSLVFTNLISLPLMNTVGLFLEESEAKDYTGILSFWVLSYILVPFQAYASVKGFLKKHEGPWFRTPKTGRITDIFARGKFYRFMAGILPGKKVSPAFRSNNIKVYVPEYLNEYIALGTANSKFNSFGIKPKGIRWMSRLVLTLLLAFSIAVYSATNGVPEVLATNPTEPFELIDDTSSIQQNAWEIVNSGDAVGPTNATTGGACGNTGYWTQLYPGQDRGSGTCDRTTAPTPTNGYSPNGYGWILEDTEDWTFDSQGYIGAGDWTFSYYTSNGTTQGTVYLWVSVWRIDPNNAAAPDSGTLFFTAQDDVDLACSCTNDVSDFSVTGEPQHNFSDTETRLYIEYWLYISSAQGGNPSSRKIWFTVDTDGGATDPYVDVSSVRIPENVIYFALLTPFIPFLVKAVRRRDDTKGI
jgi:cellulose synthase/poly-beta-1,6-N-acetylglucosamine synthase-like glycosyltransferase/transposase-like protein